MLVYAQDEVGYVSDAVVTEIAQRSISSNSTSATSSATTPCCAQSPRQVQRAGLHQHLLHAARRLRILDHCKHKLGIGHKETTRDGVFSLEEVECIGACCWAPHPDQLRLHENLTPAKVDDIFKMYRDGKGKDENNANPRQSSR